MHVCAASLEQVFSPRLLPPFALKAAPFLNDKTTQAWLEAKAVPARGFCTLAGIPRCGKVLAGSDPKSYVASFYKLESC